MLKLEVHDEPVVGALGGGLVEAGQHLGTEVSQDHAPCADPVEVADQGRVVQVVSNLKAWPPAGGRERAATRLRDHV